MSKSTSKVRSDAEQAWGEGKSTYLVRLTQIPSFKGRQDDDDDSKPARVLPTRFPDFEDAIEAIVEVGWVVRDLQFGEKPLKIMGSTMDLPVINAVFVRPSA